MQEFKMPLSEIEEKFTLSEMAIMSWSSQEHMAGLEKRSVNRPTRTKESNTKQNKTESLPEHFYNEEGEIDLRRVTGKEAYRFLSSQGIKIPIIKR
jgi:hypothetical protein